jgi:hypothetical protein
MKSDDFLPSVSVDDGRENDLKQTSVILSELVDTPDSISAFVESLTPPGSSHESLLEKNADYFGLLTKTND